MHTKISLGGGEGGGRGGVVEWMGHLALKQTVYSLVFSYKNEKANVSFIKMKLLLPSWNLSQVTVNKVVNNVFWTSYSPGKMLVVAWERFCDGVKSLTLIKDSFALLSMWQDLANFCDITDKSDGGRSGSTSSHNWVLANSSLFTKVHGTSPGSARFWLFQKVN